MPNIPRYDISQIAPAGPSNARVDVNTPADAFGGNTGNVYGELRGLVTDQQKLVYEKAREAKEKADESAVFEAIAAAQNKANDLMFNQQTGLIQKRGKDALGAPEQVMGDYQVATSDIMNGLGNEEQKIAFKKHALNIGVHLNRDAQVHVDGVLQRQFNESNQSLIDSQLNTLALHYGDPEMRKNSLETIQNALVIAGTRNGEDAVTTDAKIAAITSHANMLVLSNMLAAGDDVTAAEYFKDNESGFAGKDLAHARAAVENGTTIGAAQRLAAKIVNPAEVYNPYEGGTVQPKGAETEEEALQEGRAATEDNPKLQEAVVKQIRELWYEKRIAQKAKEDQSYEEAAKQLRETGDLPALQKTLLWESLPEYRKDLIEALNARMQKPILSEKFEKKRAEILVDFRAKSRDQIAQMSKADMEELVPYLKDGEQESVMKYWQDARNREDNVTFMATKQDEESIFKAVSSAGLAGLVQGNTMHDLASKKGGDWEKKKKDYQDIADEVMAKWNAFTSDERKKPTQEQRIQILNDVVVQHVVEDRLAGKNVSFLNSFVWRTSAAFGPYADVKVADAERARIKSFVLAVSGTEPSEGKIKLLKHAESLHASPKELNRLASMELGEFGTKP